MDKIKVFVVAAIVAAVGFGICAARFVYLNRNGAPNYVIQIDMPEEIIGISTDPKHPEPMTGYWQNGRLHIGLLNYKK